VIVPNAAKERFARLLGDQSKKRQEVHHHQQYTALTPATFRTLLDSGILNGVQFLTLGGEVDADDLRRFAESSAPRQLRSLTLYRLETDPASLRFSWRLSANNLKELEIDTVALGDAGVADLCAGTLIPRDALAIRNAGLTSAAAVTLAGCDRLERLTRLDLNGNRIGVDGLAAILASPSLDGLEQLNAAGADGLPLAILSALFAAPPRLELNLSNGLRILRLDRSSRGPAKLFVSDDRYDHRPLNWPGEGVCPEPLAGLSFEQFGFTPTTWKRLRAWLSGQTRASLTFTSCELRNDDVAEVLKLVEQTAPTELDLFHNAIGVNGCKALANSPALATVRLLDLTGNPIRLSGAMAIAESENRGKLKTFRAASLGRTLSVAERKKLTAAFKGVKVYL